MKPSEIAAIRARIGRIAREVDPRLDRASQSSDGRWRTRYSLTASYERAGGARMRQQVFSTYDLELFLELTAYAHRVFKGAAERDCAA